MLKVLQSNRLEVLASHFSREMRHARNSASRLAAETVIVPNPGVARWLWLHLAQQHGISANLDCVLPGSYVWRVFHRLIDDVPEQSPYEPAIMTWRLHRLLLEVRGDPAYAGLLSWRDTDDDRGRFELANRLARLFDQYIVYRPDWIQQWRDGKTEGWQQQLWSRLAAETGEPDWMGLRRRLEDLDPELIRARMPKRISLFGIPLLSPGYLEVMTWLGQHIDVNFFLPNPCQEHWADIVAERDFSRVAGVADEKLLYIETGNALLASWGAQGRDLLDLIQENETGILESEFIAPGNDTLLHAVQTQILELRDPGTEDQAPATVDQSDDSIQIHVCHSPTREVEVLHDQLLRLFDDNEYAASDVIVMTPHIDIYAPLIDAVFTTPKLIPFHLADVDARLGNPLIETFMSLFDLAARRFDANHVLEILEMPAVRRRFGLDEEELRQIHDWVRETGIRWGLDASDRTQYGREDAGLHSWQHGLNRLLLGFVLPRDSNNLFGDILPYDNLEGSAGLTLGSLAEFLSSLKSFVTSIETTRTAADWTHFLHGLLAKFFDVHEEQENEAQCLRDAINTLGEYAGSAGHSEEITIDLVTDWLTQQLVSNTSSRGFLGHGVTFCGIVPMRSVPFRVVCLLGLNDNAFPRIERPAGFDLIGQEPRRGDRSRREDDRQAFLECLLNTRDIFYLSYIGRGIRDNADIPPSVLVSEVIDYCNRSFVMADKNPVGDSLVVHHRVQAFSQHYFDNSNSRLFSYSDPMTPVAADLLQPPEFFQTPLAGVDDERRQVDIDKLIAFYKNPAKILLKDRLDISYDGESDPHETDDPVLLEGLDKWSVGSLLLEMLDSGRSREEALAIARNGRYTPIGPVGDATLATIMNDVERLWSGLQTFRPTTERMSVGLEFSNAEFTLTGRLEHLYESGQYLWRFGRTRPCDRMALWIRHLALNLEQPGKVRRVSQWFARDEKLRIDPIANAEQHLSLLVQLFRQGKVEPLAFFPDASWEYAEIRQSKGDQQMALVKAQEKFEKLNHFDRCERLDPYINRLFRHGVDWEQFEKVSWQVYGPLLQKLGSHD